MNPFEEFLNAAPKPEELPEDHSTPESFNRNFEWTRKQSEQYDPIVDKYAALYPDVPNLARHAKAMIMRESSGNEDATSGVGAGGLMQVMPTTIEAMGGDPERLYEPDYNIQYGTRYLAQQMRKFKDPIRAYAAYNAGPGNVDWAGNPAYKETYNHGLAVSAYYRRLQNNPFDDFLSKAPNTTTPQADPFSAFLAQAPGQSPAQPIPDPQNPVQNPAQPAVTAPPAKTMPYLPTGFDTRSPAQVYGNPAPDIHTAQKIMREKAITEAEGAKFYQAQADQEQKPAQLWGVPTYTGATTPQTPEAYQAEKMGQARGISGVYGDVVNALTDHWTGLLINAIKGESPYEAAGKRIEQTKAAIDHKRYLESPEYQTALATAQEKKQQGQKLSPQDESALKADPSFWQEMADMGKQFYDNPAGTITEFGLQMAKDFPVMIATGQGIGGLLSVLGKGAATGVEVAQAGRKLQTLKSLGAEAAQNIGGVAGVNYPEAAARGENYGLKEGLRDVATGAIMTGAHHALGKGVDAATSVTAADVEGKAQPPIQAGQQAAPAAAAPDRVPMTNEQLIQRQMQNAIVIANVRKAGAEAGIPSDHVEDFIKGHQSELQRTDEPLEFMVQEMKTAYRPRPAPEPAKGTIARYEKAKAYLTKGDAEPTDAEIGSYLKDLGDGPVPVRETRVGHKTPLYDRMNRSNEFYHTEALLHGQAEENSLTTPTEASKLPDAFEIFGTKLTKVKAKDESLVRFKDAGGHTYDFAPTDMIHTGGDVNQIHPESDPQPLNLKPDMQEEDLPFDTRRPLMQEGPAKEADKAPGPVFYSQLKRVVDAKMPNAMGPEAFKNMLKANAVKDEEIQWTGLDDFLKGKEKVTKKEIEDHLDQNQVEVKEIAKGGMPKALEGLGYDESQVETGAKYSNYQEPGGQNYRELLLTLPEKTQEKPTGPRGWAETGNANRSEGDTNYRSGHWEEPNVLAHVRFNDRTTPDGKKVLHLEEVQSDWHQAGRKAGYRDEAAGKAESAKLDKMVQEKKSALEEARKELGADKELDYVFGDNKHISPEEYKRLEAAEHEYKIALQMRISYRPEAKVPDAPFKKTWHEMALRRMLRYAAENGYDYLSWTGGEKQAARYDLSKQVKSIGAARMETDNGTRYAINAVDKHGTPHHLGSKSAAELSDVVGKELAEKIVAQKEPSHTYEGLDLKVGGEGMKGFYDKIVPDYLRKYGKKWGANVQDVPVNLQNFLTDKFRYEGPTLDQHQLANRYAELQKSATVSLFDQYKGIFGDVLRGVPFKKAMEAHGSMALAEYFGGKMHSDPPPLPQGIPITPEMKASVMEGQSLFQKTKKDVPKGSYHFDESLRKHIITLVKGQADISTLFHEYFHYLEQAKVIPPGGREILARALKAYGIQNPLDKDGRFTPEAAEKAARWYERFLRDGKVRDPDLKPTFENIQKAMNEVYKDLRGTDLQGDVPKEFRKDAHKVFEGLSAEIDDTQPAEDAPGAPVDLQAAVVPGLKEFIEQDFGPATAETKQAFKDLLSDLAKVLSPRVGVDMKALDLVYRMKGDREKAMFTMEQGMRHIKKMFINMGDQACINFIDRVKQGKKQENSKLQDIADLYRELDNETFKEIIQYKPTLAYKEGHFRIFYSNYKILEKNPKLKASLQGGKGFMKKMIFPDLSEAMKAGLTPISLNPQVLFEKGQADALRYISAQRMWNSLKDKGFAKFVKTGDDTPDGFVKLDDKISKVYFKGPRDIEKTGEYYIEPNIGRILNNYLSEDWLRSRAYGRGLLAIKNLTTGIELSLSPFHFAFETLDAMASKFGLGLTKLVNEGRTEGLADMALAWKAPVDFARAGGKALKYFSNKEAFLKTTGGQKFVKQFPEIDALMNDLFLGGGKLAMHEDYKINTIDTFKQNLNSHNYIGAALRAFPAFNEMLMKPLFETYIPRLKVGLFLNEMSQQMRQNADPLSTGKLSRAKIARDTWDRVENRFGEMNFDNLFWNRTFKSAMQMMARSVTWKLGSLRGMGNAAWHQGRLLAESAAIIKDAEGVRAIRRPKIDPSAAWMVGVLSTTAALSTIIQKSLTGQWPQEPIDFMFPKDGTKDKNGNDNRVSLPTYLRDAFSFKHSPVTYVAHSMSGLMSHTIEVLQNRDFYGDFVFDPEGSLVDKSLDIAKYMLPKPFSFTQISKSMEDTGTPAQKALGFLGVNKAPKEYIQTKFQEELARAFERQVGLKPKTPEQKEMKIEKKVYLKDLREGKASGQEILGALEKGLVKPKSAKRDVKMSGLSPMQYMWKMLSKDEKTLLEPLMSDKEHQILMWPHMPKMPVMPKLGDKPKPVSA